MNHEHRPGNFEVGRMSDQDKRYKQLAPELTLARTKKRRCQSLGSLGRGYNPDLCCMSTPERLHT